MALAVACAALAVAVAALSCCVPWLYWKAMRLESSVERLDEVLSELLEAALGDPGASGASGRTGNTQIHSGARHDA